MNNGSDSNSSSSSSSFIHVNSSNLQILFKKSILGNNLELKLKSVLFEIELNWIEMNWIGMQSKAFDDNSTGGNLL